MLQQTQVARVVPAFERFVGRFPDAAALARASEREVLAHWQGLGYYRRARLLKAAAAWVVEQHGGTVPTDAQLLLELPGVGRYVAGAIASIVAGAREPIVDGNVTRVMLRLHGRSDAPDDAGTVRWLWDRAQEWVDDARDPSAANEGLMELGATVCTPRAPRCSGCPLAARCAAKRQGTVEGIPAPKRKAVAAARQRPGIMMSTIVALHRGRVALERRPSDGLWAGMWQTPTIEVGGAVAHARGSGIWRGAMRIGEVNAALSHRRVRIEVWAASAATALRLRRSAPQGWSWVHVGKLGEMPLSNAMRRVLEVAGVQAPDPARSMRRSVAAGGAVPTRQSGSASRAASRRASGRRAGTVRA